MLKIYAFKFALELLMFETCLKVKHINSLFASFFLLAVSLFHISLFYSLVETIIRGSLFRAGNVLHMEVEKSSFKITFNSLTRVALEFNAK